VLTESTGEVGIEVPRDREGTFEPQIVKKRQRRLTGVDEIVLSLYAKGLTTGEISAAVFIDAIVVKVRDGQVANRPVYAAIGVKGLPEVVANAWPAAIVHLIRNTFHWRRSRGWRCRRRKRSCRPTRYTDTPTSVHEPVHRPVRRDMKTAGGAGGARTRDRQIMSPLL
jgi:hypothetical protein